MASSMQDTLKSFGAAQWGGGTPSAQILEHDQRLCDACRVGDYNAAKRALEDGANPSVRFRLALGEITPIFLCASKGYIDIAELLIEHHADINWRMEFDQTISLHHAASNNQPEMCEFLISRGCNVNQSSKEGRTPLMDAAEIGSIRVIDVLLENNADINIEDREHHTALSYCIDFVSKKEPKFFDCAVRLVNQGANPNYAGKFANRTLLHCAAAQGNLELVQQLVEVNKAALRVYDNEGKTPIKYAIDNKHQDVYDYLQQRLDLDNSQLSDCASVCALLCGGCLLFGIYFGKDIAGLVIYSNTMCIGESKYTNALFGLNDWLLIGCVVHMCIIFLHIILGCAGRWVEFDKLIQAITGFNDELSNKFIWSWGIGLPFWFGIVWMIIGFLLWNDTNSDKTCETMVLSWCILQVVESVATMIIAWFIGQQLS
eukprot:246935_1